MTIILKTGLSPFFIFNKGGTKDKPKQTTKLGFDGANTAYVSAAILKDTVEE
jgi:hypothetical protein